MLSRMTACLAASSGKRGASQFDGVLVRPAGAAEDTALSNLLAGEKGKARLPFKGNDERGVGRARLMVAEAQLEAHAHAERWRIQTMHIVAGINELADWIWLGVLVLPMLIGIGCIGWGLMGRFD